MTQKYQCNIVMPASGHGKRFTDAGYTAQKPFIDIFGAYMFKLAFDSIGVIGEQNIFILNEHNLQPHHVKYIENNIENSKIILESAPLSGQANSILQAQELIDNETPLFICNCDHKILWDINAFFNRINILNADAGVCSFYTDRLDPIYSYLNVNDCGYITEIKEKERISNFALAGMYYFKHGSDFVKYCHLLKSKKILINNEYYLSQVFNEMLLDNRKIINTLCHKIISFGTPNDLTQYLKTKSENYGNI